MAHFYNQILLFILLKIIMECRVGSTDVETVSGVQQEDVALSCLDSNVMDSASSYRLEWIKKATATKEEQVIFEWPKRSQEAKRVKLEEDGKGQMCLFLKRLEKSDAGLYTYKIWKGWDLHLVKEIFLKVKDCKSLPVVKAVLCSSVTLDCSVDTTSGLQEPLNISWTMMKGTNFLSVDSKRAERNGTCLTMQSVTASDSGWYRCTCMLQQTQYCFDIRLLVGDAFVVTVPTDTFLTRETQQALTVNETVLSDGKEKISETSTPVVVSVICASITLAALTGLFIYFRRRSVTERTLPTEYMDPYENVIIPFSHEYFSAESPSLMSATEYQRVDPEVLDINLTLCTSFRRKACAHFSIVNFEKTRVKEDDRPPVMASKMD